MSRPSLPEMFLQVAEVVATRSTCDRLHVGCIVTNREMTSVLSMGYNGNARGLPNGCSTDTPGNCGCDLHAEVNALIKAPYDERNLVMFCTHSPCRACAKAILNSKVRSVIFAQFYRSNEGLEILDQGHVEALTRAIVPPDHQGRGLITLMDRGFSEGDLIDWRLALAIRT